MKFLVFAFLRLLYFWFSWVFFLQPAPPQYDRGYFHGAKMPHEPAILFETGCSARLKGLG